MGGNKTSHRSLRTVCSYSSVGDCILHPNGMRIDFKQGVGKMQMRERCSFSKVRPRLHQQNAIMSRMYPPPYSLDFSRPKYIEHLERHLHVLHFSFGRRHKQEDKMDIGAHCSVGSCNQVDFLPFTCDCCQSVFCLHHRTYDAHECPQAGSKDRRVIECPLCKQMLHWTLEQDVNVVWEDHVRGGSCAPKNGGKALGTDASQATTKKKKKPRCAADSCREILTASNQFHCTKCRQEVCLKHRFESDHGCESARKQKRQQQPWSLGGFTSTPKAPSNANSQATNADRRKSSTGRNANTTAQLQQNAKQAATSVVNGTRSAVSSLVQNAKVCRWQFS